MIVCFRSETVEIGPSRIPFPKTGVAGIPLIPLSWKIFNLVPRKSASVIIFY